MTNPGGDVDSGSLTKTEDNPIPFQNHQWTQQCWLGHDLSLGLHLITFPVSTGIVPKDPP